MSLQDKLKVSAIIMTLGVLSACSSSAPEQVKPANTDEQSKAIKQTTNNNSADTSSSSKTTSTEQEASSQVASVEDISVDFKLDNGSPAFKFLHSKENGELLDANGKVMMTFSENQGKDRVVRVQDNSNNVVCYVKIAKGNDHIKIEDSSNHLLYKLNMESDGDYKLKDAAGTTVYKLKEESYGFKIKAGDDSEGLYKIKQKDGKNSLKNAEGKTVLYSKSEMPKVILACFGMDKLPKNLQYALAYSLLFMRL
ncbi:MAG: hypothetical protein K2X81_03825 [Candidatus Obscuribacterales bacterium]|nr:hypothetical protein [Candidatus Obscuribacterales bacterium]